MNNEVRTHLDRAIAELEAIMQMEEESNVLDYMEYSKIQDALACLKEA